MSKIKKNYFITISFLTLHLFAYSQSNNYFEEAKQDFFDNKNDIAIKLFEKAIENKQEISKSYMYLGYINSIQDNLTDAFKNLDISLKLDSSYYLTYYFYGYVYLNQEKSENALLMFNKALEKKFVDADCFDGRAKAKFKLNDFKGSMEDEDKAIKFDSLNASFYANRGFCKFKLGNYSESIQDYNRGLRIDSNYSVLLANRGLAFASLGMHTYAIRDYSRVISILGKAPEIFYFRGLSYEAVRNKNEACNDFAIAVSLGYLPAIIEQTNICVK